MRPWCKKNIVWLCMSDQNDDENRHDFSFDDDRLEKFRRLIQEWKKTLVVWQLIFYYFFHSILDETYDDNGSVFSLSWSLNQKVLSITNVSHCRPLTPSAVDSHVSIRILFTVTIKIDSGTINSEKEKIINNKWQKEEKKIYFVPNDEETKLNQSPNWNNVWYIGWFISLFIWKINVYL